MTWFLFVIYLSSGAGMKAEDVVVKHGEIIRSFGTEESCGDTIRGMIEAAKQEKREIPSHINFGCVPVEGSYFKPPGKDERTL